MADKTSYYFVDLSALRGVDCHDIYFQTTGMQLYYTANDRPPACSMISDVNSSCCMSLPSSQAIQLSLAWKDHMCSGSHDDRQHWYWFWELYAWWILTWPTLLQLPLILYTTLPNLWHC